MTQFKRVAAELLKGGSLTLSSVADGFDAFCAADLTRALARDAQKMKTMGQAARAAAPDYDRVKELQKFAEVFDHLAATK